MSVIQQILTEISGFIEGPDHSNSARFRHLAQSYADACSVVHDDLEECRRLIESGLAAEALYKNNHAQPALTERAHMLLFPGRKKWIELCVLYQAAIPVDFDMTLIEKLESGEFGKAVESNADLQAQWRILARTGTTHEKILLLRKLMKSDPTTNVWRKNLETVERAWLIELQQNAQKAQRVGDLAHLYDVYRSMMSSGLLHPVPHSVLEPFMDDIRRYEKEEMMRKQEKTVHEVAAAYDLADLKKLQTALEQWEKLSKEPLYEAQELQLAQITEATNFLTEKRKQQNDERQATELRARLHLQLDDPNVPFATVSQTFHALQQINQVDIDPDLANRFRNAENRYNSNLHRKYVRTLVLWILTAVFVGLGLAFVIQTVQEYRQTKTICAEMQTLIEKGAPNDAIRFYEDLQKKDPKAAARNAVIAQKQNAVRLSEQQQAEQTAFGELLKSIDGQLSEEKVELPETTELFKSAETFAGYHTEEQKVQLLNFCTRQQELLRKIQDKRDEAFLQKTEDIRKELFQLDTKLNEKDTVNTVALEQQLLKIQENVQTLFDGSGNVTERFRMQEKESFDRQFGQIRSRITGTDAYQKTVRFLNEPQSIQEYLTGLTDVPVKAPAKLNEFRDAESQVRFLQNRDKLVALLTAESPSPELLSERFHAAQSADPWCRDVQFLLSNPDAFAQTMKDLKVMQDQELPDWKLYEIVLPFDGKNFYFYLKNKKDLEVERAGGGLGGEYRSITFKDHRDHIWLMSVKRIPKTDEYELEVVKSGVKIPLHSNPITMKSMTDFNARKIPLASYYSPFSATLQKLLSAKDLSQLSKILYDEILSYARMNDINPAVRAEILSKLLDFYGKSSELDREVVKRIRKDAGFDDWKAGAWMEPDAAIPGEAFLAKAGDYFKSDAFTALCRNSEFTYRVYRNVAALRLIPAGVLYRRDGKLVCHFFADKIKSEEYIVFLKYSTNEMRSYILPPELTGTGTMELPRLSPELSVIRNGEIFYSSAARISLRKQLMPEVPAGAELFRTPEILPVNYMPEPAPGGQEDEK